MVQGLSTLRMHQKSLGGLVKTQVAGLHLRASESVGLGWGLRICISRKFLNLVVTVGLGTTP